MRNQVRYWWVSQNKTYNEERPGNYFWAPVRNEKGQSFYHWTNVSRLQPGDIVFCYFGQKIVSIAEASSFPYRSESPREWEFKHGWLRDGWKINVAYMDLPEPVPINEFSSDLLLLLQKRYGPVNRSGTGNQGYLFEMPKDAAELLLEKLNWMDLGGGSDRRSVKKPKEPPPGSTDGSAQVKTRIGHQRFKKDLMQYWENSCAVTGSAAEELLRASHIKSWSESTDTERLDVYNGLLLSPTYDAAFDAHLISFQNNGEIIISSLLAPVDLNLLGIDPDARLTKIDSSHADYLEIHRAKLVEINEKRLY